MSIDKETKCVAEKSADYTTFMYTLDFADDTEIYEC